MYSRQELVKMKSQRKRLIRRRWIRLERILLLLLLLGIISFASCSVEDMRDVCCDEIILRYRYVREQRDEYHSFIKKERRYLFDSRGIFLREIAVDPSSRQRVHLRRLPVGQYYMLTVANQSPSYTFLTTMQEGETTLREVFLSLDKSGLDEKMRTYNKLFAPAEPLFWNLRPFVSRRGQRHTYICDMANIHCYLYVLVSWEKQPPRGSDRFTIELSKLIASYRLESNPDYTLQVAGRLDAGGNRDESTSRYVVHHFPYSLFPAEARIQQEVSLRGHELFYEVRSLRYLNDAIPTIQLIHEGQPMFRRSIDLTPLFHSWGWYPNMHPEQIYRIEMKLLKDGRVEVKPWVTSSVLDWVNGGSF